MKLRPCYLSTHPTHFPYSPPLYVSVIVFTLRIFVETHISLLPPLASGTVDVGISFRGFYQEFCMSHGIWRSTCVSRPSPWEYRDKEDRRLKDDYGGSQSKNPCDRPVFYLFSTHLLNSLWVTERLGRLRDFFLLNLTYKFLYEVRNMYLTKHLGTDRNLDLVQKKPTFVQKYKNDLGSTFLIYEKIQRWRVHSIMNII